MVLLAARQGDFLPVNANETIAPWIVEEATSCAVTLSSPHEPVPGAERWLGVLPPQLSNARQPRVSSFLAGRYCAKMALERAGAAAGETVRFGADRAPVWPDGFVGSITHTADFAGAVAAPKNCVAGVGIDTEKLLSEAEARELRQTVAPELGEINFIGLDADGDTEALVVSCLFSAKESIYKCLHPLVREFFEFSDVSVTQLDRDSGTIHTVLNRPLGMFPRNWRFSARFKLDDGRVHTSAVLRANQLPTDTAGSFGFLNDPST